MIFRRKGQAYILCRYIIRLMEDAGLQVQIDAIGNTYGMWEGSDPTLGRASGRTSAQQYIDGEASYAKTLATDQSFALNEAGRLKQVKL